MSDITSVFTEATINVSVLTRYPSLVRHLSIWNTSLAWFQDLEQLTTERRVPISRYTAYRFDDFLVDSATWRLYRNNQEVHLEPTVLRLLIYLISHRDRLVTRQELMDTVWDDSIISESALSKAVARLRKALGDEAMLPKYVETVHSLGYRFVAEVEEIKPPDTAGQEAKGSRKQAYGLRYFMVVLVVLLAVLLIFLWPDAPQKDSPAPDGIDSIAVLPLTNLTGDSSLDFFVDGVHEALITELSQVSQLRVTSRQSTLRYKTSELSMTTIAAELGVDVLVEGSALQVGEQVELSVQLIDGHTDEHLWTDRYVRDTPHVFDLLSDVASTIVANIPSVQENELVIPALDHSIGEIDPNATFAYLRGLGYLNQFSKDGLNLAIEQFTRAVAIEPGFALAWGNMAAAQAMVAAFGHGPAKVYIEEARASALKAVEANDRAFIGYSALGWVLYFTREYPGACNAFQKALQINPSDPYSLHGKADCLMQAGHMEESIAPVRKAQLIAPFTPMHSRPLVFHLFMARKYEEAIASALDLQERIPSHSMHDLLALCYWQQGRLDEALVEKRQDLEWRKEHMLIEALEEGLIEAGPRGAMLAVAKAMVERSETTYTDPFRISQAFALAGASDEAFFWLDRAVNQGSMEVVYIPFRADFDVIRNDPRYAELLRSLGYLKKGPGGTSDLPM